MGESFVQVKEALEIVEDLRDMLSSEKAGQIEELMAEAQKISEEVKF